MKTFWKSKTLWFNLITVVGAGTDALIGTNYLSPLGAASLVTGMAVVNAGLRLATSKAVILR